MQVEVAVGCPWCGRRIHLKGDVRLYEHTPPGLPAIKCEGSFRYPWERKNAAP